MPTQNNEFNPQRLKLALELKRWTQKKLAAKMDITSTTLSLIMNAKLPFSTAHAETASMATGLPLNFFVLPSQAISPDQLTFRKTSNVSRTRIKSMSAEYSLMESAVTSLGKMCRTDRRADWIDNLAPNTSPTSTDIEELAQATRKQLGITARGRVDNVIRSLEKGGIVIAAMATAPSEDPTQNAKMEGVTHPQSTNAPLTIGYFPGARPGDGTRFTIAHELGHAILQRKRHPVSGKVTEAEASAFASAFLLPKYDAFAAIRPSMKLMEYADVKAQWGISIAAAVRRARDLDIITPDRYKSLQIQINQMHWRRAEPVTVEQEHPIYLKQLVGSALGTIKTATEVSVAPPAVEQYLGLPFDMVSAWADGLTPEKNDWNDFDFQ
ncbi:XRE family transcriptional regulator [Bifidobacterium sp. ESL0690]|uniref:XRE family transcriptional regulator n=1 Tax=Bifidobacterium sp. ESL0690 TaxID=2983214 RepID=UPI0023F8F870|nr:XRE family transcriptional regulator [Bifidobacterium sp. ESL0690]WEV46450.1 XRE family transcriptional regulator [Bifidobacterium sp. ESL0690]